VTFEEAERELQQIVERLESGNVPLDDAVALWERGEQLYRLCRERLDAAHGQVEELARRVEDARPAPAPPAV
jgi:exodeoxyribonuclease VII small subunit